MPAPWSRSPTTCACVHVRGVSSRSRPLFVEWHKHRGLWRYFRKFEAPQRGWLTRARGVRDDLGPVSVRGGAGDVRVSAGGRRQALTR